MIGKCFQKGFKLGYCCFVSVILFFLFSWSKASSFYLVYTLHQYKPFEDSIVTSVDNRTLAVRELSSIMDSVIQDKGSTDRKQLRLIESGLELAKKLNLKAKQGTLYRYLLRYYAYNEDSEKAIFYGLQSARIFDSLRLKDELILTNSDLIPIYTSSLYLEKALDVSLQNLELMADKPESAEKARYYFGVGNAQRALKHYEDALVNYQEAFRLAKKYNFNPGLAVINSNIGQLYLEQKEYKAAETKLYEALTYFENTDQKLLIANTIGFLGEAALKGRKHEHAIDLFEEALGIYTFLSLYDNIAQTKKKLHLLYSIVGNYDQALRYEEDYLKISDSLARMDREKIIADIETKYETEKKEAEIAVLSQKAQIQELRISQRNQVIIIGLILILLVAIVFYFIVNARNASNRRKQIELEQRFLRSQLNPHFVSNALVAVQSSLIEGDTQAAGEYLLTFSRLMREILENSREEKITLEDEVSMLRDYLAINQKRLKNFTYALEIDESIEPEMDMIPPMLIQPFVENAIEHGLAASELNGHIEITIQKSGDSFKVSIRDNGGGISDLDTEEGKSSLSTTIIKERIALFNQALKNKINLIVGNWEDERGQIGGAEVILQLPIL